jgi:hypothetical protein
VPALARLERDLPADDVSFDLPALGEDHLRMRGVAWVLQQELVVLLREANRDRIRQRLRTPRVAECEVVLLDGEDVREVALDLECELERLALHALVLDDDHVLHALADEALAHDRDDVLLEPAGERVAKEERRGEVLDLAGREQQRPDTVHLQAQHREEARVLRVEPVRAAVDVADVVANAEGRALEDGQLRH